MQLYTGASIGVANKSKIPDAQITASSTECMTPAYFGRLNQTGACYSCWIGKAKSTKWLQIDMGNLHSVTYITTQGTRQTDANHVRTFYLMHTIDTVKWKEHVENGQRKVSVRVTRISVNVI